MGILGKILSPPSSMAAKKHDIWAELKDRVDGALLPTQLDELEAWLDGFPLEYPAAYREPLNDLIEAKRAELEAEDVGFIVRDRFDFT